MLPSVPLMRHIFIDDADARRALSEFVLTADRLSMATECAEFEREFAAWQGRKHAVLFNSGASANLAIFQALLNLGSLESGSNVGASALTWSTNVMPLMQLGFGVEVFDVDPCTLNITGETVGDSLAGIDAVFATNALGFLPDLNNLRALCYEQGIPLIEDNCESLGSALPSGKAGNFGLAASFSFFVAHHMSTIEGGMACTDDNELAEMLRIVRANGWDRNLTPEQQQKRRNGVSPFNAAYTFYDLGYNLRPTEITGFLGRHQLRRLDENINRRAAHFTELESAAYCNPDFIRLNHDHQTRLSPFAFPLVCRTPALRNCYIERFTQAGVEVRPMIAGNITRQPFWRKYYGEGWNGLRGADFVHERGFYFGIYPDLTREDLALLKECLS